MKILTYYMVLPGFLDILLSFGQKIWEKDENFSIYHQYVSRKRPISTADSSSKSIGKPSLPTSPTEQILTMSSEVCYNLKYAVQRKDSMSKDPNSLVYTTRKVGIWSKFYPAEDRTVWILVNPPASFGSRLPCLLGNCDIKEDMAVHLLHLSCADENWEGYINQLEGDFYKLVCL